MPDVLVEAERCAIRTYTVICNMTFGKDHRTYDMAVAILHDGAVLWGPLIDCPWHHFQFDCRTGENHFRKTSSI